jgi:integrase
MPTTKLTQAAVDNLKPPATGRVEWWDSQLPGFGLRVSETGRKTWMAMYRVNGKLVRETIGTVALIPAVGDARDRARKSMQTAQSGEHPVEARKRHANVEAKEAAEAEALARDTVSAVIDRYLTGYAKRRMRPDYYAETMRTLERDVKGSLGNRPLREISRRDLRELLESIVERGSPSHANHVLAYSRAMLNWAVSNDIIETNPADGLKMPAPLVQRDRALNDDEIRLFWLACDKIGGPFGSLFKLLLLTAQRRDELAHATWPEFDLDKALWMLPRARTKNDKAHLVHLAPGAVAILSKLPKVGKKGFLFTTTGETPVSGFGRARERLDAAMLDIRKAEMVAAGEALEDMAIDPFTLHDLRRTAATGMAAIGVAHHVLDKVLNHVGGKISGVARIYNRFEYLPERKLALDAWAQHLESVARGDALAKASVVLPFAAAS